MTGSWYPVSSTAPSSRPTLESTSNSARTRSSSSSGGGSPARSMRRRRSPAAYSAVVTRRAPNVSQRPGGCRSSHARLCATAARSESGSPSSRREGRSRRRSVRPPCPLCARDLIGIVQSAVARPRRRAACQSQASPSAHPASGRGPRRPRGASRRGGLDVAVFHGRIEPPKRPGPVGSLASDAISGALPRGGRPGISLSGPFAQSDRAEAAVFWQASSRDWSRARSTTRRRVSPNPLIHRYFSTFLIGRFLAPSLRGLVPENSAPCQRSA